MSIRAANPTDLKPSTVSKELALFFTKDEYNDVINRLQKKSVKNSQALMLASDLREYIWELTRGHPGGVIALLKSLQEVQYLRPYAKKNEEVPLKEASRFLDDIHELGEDPSHTPFNRSLPNFTIIQELPELGPWCERMLASDGLVSNVNDQVAQDFFQRRGWVHTEVAERTNPNGFKLDVVVYIFPSKLHRKIIEHLFLTPNFPRDRFPSLTSLVRATLRNFRQINDRKPHLTSGGIRQPVEAQYQDEFYRACFETLNNKIYLESEYSPPGETGKVDFLVSEMRWAVECVREGDRLQEHVARFETKGTYSGWIADGRLSHWLILDFRLVGPTTKQLANWNLPVWVYFVIFEKSTGVCRVVECRGNEKEKWLIRK